MNHRRRPAPPPPPPQQLSQYPHEIQLKLYQAFIFSIPILFSIILFLLFYLFYLKRRRSSSHLLPTSSSTNNNNNNTNTNAAAAAAATGCDSDMKNEELKNNKLCIILFDEYMEEPTRDSLCSVCLGELEYGGENKEEEEELQLVRVGECKHVFHAGCIHLWLHAHSTCPLCRAPIHHHPY